jgi:hypothetical protein
MNLKLQTLIMRKAMQNNYVTAASVAAHGEYTRQYVSRVLKEMSEVGQLEFISDWKLTKYYRIAGTHVTMDDIRQKILLERQRPGILMGGVKRTPTEFLSLMKTHNPALFDPDSEAYINYSNEVIPQMLVMVHGKRSSSEAELLHARAVVMQFADRVEQAATFLRSFLDNDSIADGSVADMLSDYMVNKFKSRATQHEEAS